MEDIKKLEINKSKELHIQLENQLKNELEIQELKNFLFGTSGNCFVYFHIDTNKGNFTIKASTQMTVPADKEFLNRLRDIPFVKEVWLA